MVGRDTLSVRIGLGLGWAAPVLGFGGIASVRSYNARTRRFGVLLVLLTAILVCVRYALTFLALGSFWPTVANGGGDTDGWSAAALSHEERSNKENAATGAA